MARRRKGRQIDGVLLVDKPQGWSSNAVLQKVRWLFQAQKAGHCGALDPLATGLLPICLGEATKFSRFLLNANKAYLTEACLGIRTDTLDSEGKITEQKAVPPIHSEAIQQLLDRQFTGDILQIPPMYSALKRDGRPLYELARAGMSVEIAPRPVSIFHLDLKALTPLTMQLDIACSKGTYIRSLVDDIGQAMGCGAHVVALRRTHHAHFNLQSAISLDALIELQAEGLPALDQHLLTIDDMLVDLPLVQLDSQQSRDFLHGQGGPVAESYQGQVRVRNAATGAFLGVADLTDQQLKPVRVMANHQ